MNPMQTMIVELLESSGAITDYLIYVAMPGSKKVGAALEHGGNMISEKSFAEMLQQNRWSANKNHS